MPLVSKIVFAEFILSRHRAHWQSVVINEYQVTNE